MISTFKEKIKDFERPYEFKLTKKLPLIIVLNGRSFKKTTSLFSKPYSPDFVELMGAVMLKLSSEIDGTVLCYSYNDEIILVSRNDQFENTEMIYGGDLQKICSVSSSIATSTFINIASQKELSFIGDPVFTSQVFLLPNIEEVINFLTYKQYKSFSSSLFFACFFNLITKYDINIVLNTIKNLTIDEQIDLLQDEFKIDYYQYPLAFRRGIACYRVPQVIENKSGRETRNKLFVNLELPQFSKNSDFLFDILEGREVLSKNV